MIHDVESAFCWIVYLGANLLIIICFALGVVEAIIFFAVVMREAIRYSKSRVKHLAVVLWGRPEESRVDPVTERPRRKQLRDAP